MIDRMLSGGVIAVVRLPEQADLRPIAAALAAGGVDVVELTLTTPGALEAIAELASDEGLKGCMVGAGTVLDVKAAREVIARGARFVVSPTFDRFVVRYCNDHYVPCLPGALTPTELLAASRAGASAVKLFPASAVGPRYLREVLAPLPFLRVVPSGGVSVDPVLRGGSRLGLYFVEPGADLRAMRVVYDRAGSAFSQITPADVDWAAALARAKWLHGTGITPALGDGPAHSLGDGFAAARERGVTVSLDLNYREALWRGRDPRSLIETFARQADVLIGNREAVRAMLGVEANGDALAPALADRFGCRAVAITQR